MRKRRNESKLHIPHAVRFFDVYERDVFVAETSLRVALASDKSQGFLRTSVDTGKAVFARAAEIGFAVFHAEIAVRAHVFAGGAGYAQ